MTTIRVIIAGSTNHTRTCAQSLTADGRFTISGVLTPSPKPRGRKQAVTPNPLHQWANEHNLPVVLVEKKIESTLKDDLKKLSCDLLLVVDFGYLIPDWLLQLPRLAPINIHPSNLPSYRGSSPGQFVLMFGEKNSAVSIIKMDEKLDHGPVIERVFFEVDPTWTAADYYVHAFTLIGGKLPQILDSFVRNLTTVTPQPEKSPTPLARILTREDGFVPLETFRALLHHEQPKIAIPLLTQLHLETNPRKLFDLWRGLTPWPGVWTKIDRDGKEIRVKILAIRFSNNSLVMETIQVEGKAPQQYKGEFLE